jgi:hypothetical protein
MGPGLHSAGRSSAPAIVLAPCLGSPSSAFAGSASDPVSAFFSLMWVGTFPQGCGLLLADFPPRTKISKCRISPASVKGTDFIFQLINFLLQEV